MSKISVIQDGEFKNGTFNPVITDISYDKLANLKNTSINLANAFIISIPNNGTDDIEGAASIWMTDANGVLFNITMPNNKILTNPETSDSFNNEESGGSSTEEGGSSDSDKPNYHTDEGSGES